MDNKLKNPELVISRNISGFHQYILSDPAYPVYVSENLCLMLGVDEKDLLNEHEDMYFACVHPADRAMYSDFIKKIAEKKRSDTAEYRLVKKDGSVICVRDTMIFQETDDGIPMGYSTLVDVTDIKKEIMDLRFLSETIPCGFLKYTCERQPKVTYINQKMKDILRFPPHSEGELDYFELYKNNIYMMIPMENRRKFALYLNRVYTAGTPIAGEISVLRCDGTRAHVFGWVTKCVNEYGVEEFQSVCMDVTERYRIKKISESKRYIKALTDVYDKIFEYDLGSNIVKCLHSNNSPMFKWLEDIPMQMEDATEKWITDTVVAEDTESVRDFFGSFYQKKLIGDGEKPPQITYRAKSSTGDVKKYTGVFLLLDDSVSLYCCRELAVMEDSHTSEYEELEESMQELVQRFTDGIAAFKVTADELVTPLYASDNVCEFFGISKEEWLPLMQKKIPLRTFVAKSEVDYDDFEELLRCGEAEFTYYDFKTEKECRIKAICSQKKPSESAPRYVMLYTIDKSDDEEKNHSGERGVSIRTFGYFDVFVDERPIAFRSQKSKELFALLVDRRGGFVSSEEAISFLWEEEPVNPVTLSRYRKVALRLKNILEEYGISDVVETVDGKRRIVMERVQCDLYDYLTGKKEYAQLFKGNYLSNYSWGENTLAELTGDILY